jgi:hypothetical protein
MTYRYVNRSSGIRNTYLPYTCTSTVNSRPEQYARCVVKLAPGWGSEVKEVPVLGDTVLDLGTSRTIGVLTITLIRVSDVSETVSNSVSDAEIQPPLPSPTAARAKADFGRYSSHLAGRALVEMGKIVNIISINYHRGFELRYTWQSPPTTWTLHSCFQRYRLLLVEHTD